MKNVDTFSVVYSDPDLDSFEPLLSSDGLPTGICSMSSAVPHKYNIPLVMCKKNQVHTYIDSLPG